MGETAESVVPADVKRPLILLVEDDENVQLIVKTVVTTMGFGFVVGANGQEGLSLAREDAEQLHVLEREGRGAALVEDLQDTDDAMIVEQRSGGRLWHGRRLRSSAHEYNQQRREQRQPKNDADTGPDILDIRTRSEVDGEHHEHAGDQPDEHCRHREHLVRAGRDADEARQRPVERHRQVRLAADYVRGDEGCDRPRGAGDRRRDEHERDEAGVGAEHRAAVEPEPAEEQQEHADRGQRHTMARDRVDLPILAVLPDARAEQDDPRQRRPTHPTVKPPAINTRLRSRLALRVRLAAPHHESELEQEELLRRDAGKALVAAGRRGVVAQLGAPRAHHLAAVVADRQQLVERVDDRRVRQRVAHLAQSRTDVVDHEGRVRALVGCWPGLERWPGRAGRWNRR